MKNRRPGLPNLKISTTILVLLLLVINSLPVVPAAATPQPFPAVAVSSGASHDMNGMDMPGMTMDMSMDGMDMSYSMLPASAGLSAITLNSVGVTVTVANFAFSPITQTVSVGTTVNWEWTSGFHSVTSDTGAFASATTSATGNNFSFTFTQPGTYYYQLRNSRQRRGRFTPGNRYVGCHRGASSSGPDGCQSVSAL